MEHVHGRPPRRFAQLRLEMARIHVVLLVFGLFCLVLMFRHMHSPDGIIAGTFGLFAGAAIIGAWRNFDREP